MSEMMLTWFVRISLCSVLVTSTSIAVAAGTQLYDVEYEVISTVIDHGVGSSAGNIIIDGVTTGEVVSVVDPTRSPDELAQDLGTTVIALREWSRSNKRRYILREKLAITGEYLLLEETERSEIFNDENPSVNWQQFRTRFPQAGGIIRVSRPGIDDVAEAAVLYLEYQCGAQCGSGRLVNLVMTDAGHWRVTTGELVWITSPE
jgi:hypothetical protein